MKYDKLIDAIAELHLASAGQAARAVNQSLVIRNWIIGAYLVEYEQHGEDRAAYGEGLLKSVASDVAQHNIKGIGVRMLERSRTLYAVYPQLAEKSAPLGPIYRKQLNVKDLRKSSPAVTIFRNEVSSTTLSHLPAPLSADRVLQLSWSHLIQIIAIDDPWKRAFYENECLRSNWSKRELQRQIGSLLYERTGLSTDKAAVIEAVRAQTAASPANIAEILRDPYILEFTGLAERSSYLEKDLETALLDDLQAFLLELGAGFCFEARQRRITVGNEHDYIDLVFYHRILRCHLLIDLKIRAFQHGDAGQMNYYLNFWKDRMMEPGDQHPVGLLLCSDRDHTKVEYATAGMDEHLFVSRYLVALPKPEELQAFVERDRAEIEAKAELETNSEAAK